MATATNAAAPREKDLDLIALSLVLNLLKQKETPRYAIGDADNFENLQKIDEN